MTRLGRTTCFGLAAAAAITASVAAKPPSGPPLPSITPNTLIEATLTTKVPLRAPAGTRFALSWTFSNGQRPWDPGLAMPDQTYSGHDGERKGTHGLNSTSILASGRCAAPGVCTDTLRSAT